MNSLENSIELINLSTSSASVLFKVVKIIGELYNDKMIELRSRYEQIAVKIWNNHKKECKEIGCEFIRVLQNVARIKSLEPIFKELAQSEVNDKPAFWNMLCSTYNRVNGDNYLILSIPYLIEKKLTDIMMNIKAESMPTCIKWILEDMKIGEGMDEGQLMLADWVRYIVANFTMPNLKTPRWYLIGWLLNYTRHPSARAQIKFALFFDWLFYEP